MRAYQVGSAPARHARVGKSGRCSVTTRNTALPRRCTKKSGRSTRTGKLCVCENDAHTSARLIAVLRLERRAKMKTSVKILQLNQETLQNLTAPDTGNDPRMSFTFPPVCERSNIRTGCPFNA